MDWAFEQAHAFAFAIVSGLVTTVLAALFISVWRKVPAFSSTRRRLFAAVRASPFASAALVVFMLATVGVLVVGWVIGPQESDDPQVRATRQAPAAAPAPSNSPSPPSLEQAGWGPVRNLVRVGERPQEATLNSVVDHPIYGDERNYMRVRLAGDVDAKYTSSVVVEAGNVYEFVVAINNDAAAGGQAAEGVRLRLQMSAVARGSAPSHAFITSTNVVPDEMWDGATLVGEDIDAWFALRYVANSAVLHTGGDASGTVLSDDVFRDGVLVGCDSLDGVLPAGDRCQSWVSFRIRIDQPNFEATAFAQPDGTGGWSETLIATDDQEAKLGVRYKNTGTTQQNDVVLRVTLPENLHLIKGSTVWSNDRARDVSATTDEIAGQGLNLGSYVPGEDVFVTFEVIVDGPPPGGTNIQNLERFFTVETNNGSKHAPLTIVWF